MLDKVFNSLGVNGALSLGDGIEVEELGDLAVGKNSSNRLTPSDNYQLYKVFFSCGHKGGSSGSMYARVGGVNSGYRYYTVDSNGIGATGNEDKWYVTSGNDRTTGVLTLNTRGWGDSSGYGGYRPSISADVGIGNQWSKILIAGGCDTTASWHNSGIELVTDVNYTIDSRIIGIKVDG